jgi:hypothetical protein
MFARALVFTLVFSLALSLSPVVEGAQYQVRTTYGAKVVHTRIAPVVMHRVLPPFYGRHVYQGRMR